MVLNPEQENQQAAPRMLPAGPQAHLKDYIGIVLQHNKLVGTIVVAALLLGAFNVWSAKPRYRATALARATQREGPEEIAGDYSSYMSREKELSTYCHIIRGWDFSRSLVQKRGMTSYEDLGLSEPRPGLLGKVKSLLTERVSTSRRGSREKGEKPSTADLAGLLQSRIEARVVENTNLIRIRYTAEDWERASSICQSIADLFIEQERERRLKSAEGWIEWFRKQTDGFETKVTESEKELISFYTNMEREEEGEMTEGVSALQRTIETLHGRQAEVRVRRIELASRLEMLKELEDKVNPVPANLSLLEDPGIEQLLRKRDEVRRQLDLNGMRYGPKHPAMREGERALALIGEDIHKQAEEAVEAIHQRLGAVQAEEETLAREIERAEKRAAQINLKLVKYNALKRKAEAKVRVLDIIITEATEADLAASIKSVNINHLTTEPEVSRAPTHGLRTMALALFLGLVAGVGLALFLDYMDTTLATPRDVERSLDLDQLAVLMHAGFKGKDKNAPVLAATEHPGAQLTENFRTLRASVLFSPTFQDTRFLVVTSATPREGKTTVAVNLAVMLAQAGKRVLLVDGDMRKPAVHKVFEMEKKPGLSEFLSGKASLEKIVRPSEVENLQIITCGSSVQKPAELIGTTSERFGELVQRGEEFDYVLFDTPPLTLSDPTLLVKSMGATALLVIRAGAVSRDVVQRSVDKLRGVQARVGGAVLNNFDIRKQGYYGYGSRYYGYYHRYYRYYSPEEEGERAQSAE